MGETKETESRQCRMKMGKNIIGRGYKKIKGIQKNKGKTKGGGGHKNKEIKPRPSENMKTGERYKSQDNIRQEYRKTKTTEKMKTSDS